MEDLCQILRDAAGNILVDGNGYVTCESKEGGVRFQIEYNEIDFDYDTAQCPIGDKILSVQLKEGASNDTVDDDHLTNEESDGNKKGAFSWNNATTKLFLEMYKEKKSFLKARKIRTKKVLWVKISESMVEHGYDVSAIQVENKFKSLERSYKNMILNNKKTGRSRMAYPYETQLTELLGHRHNMEPLAVSGKEGLKVRSDVSYNANMSTSEMFLSERLAEESLENFEESEVVTPSTSAVNLPAGNVPRHQAVTPKSRKRQMGATAKVLESCQQSIEKIGNDIQEGKESRSEIQKQILAENKALREAYERSMEKITQQLIVANQLREEKNNILKEMLLEMREKNNS